MTIARRHFLRLAASGALLPGLSSLALAQNYPERTVRLVVGYAAGGPGDALIRLTAQWLSERLGRPFVVENRPGAGCNLGTEAVVKAPPDGHTLLYVTPANAINATLIRSSVSISFATLRRWRASFAYLTSWWCIRPCRRTPCPN